MSSIGATQAAEFIPEVIANVALGELESELHLAKNVTTNMELTPAKEGDTIKVPKRGTLSVNQKVSNTDVTVQNPSADEVEVVLDQHWEVTFSVEDYVNTVKAGQHDIIGGYTADGVIKLGEKIEESLAALFANFSQSVGNAATDITDAVLRSARGTISTGKAPKRDRFLYLEPDQINAILGMDKFVHVEKYGSGMPVQEGEFGKIYGFRVFESLHVQTGAGSPTPTLNGALHRNALVLASRPLVKPMGAGVKVGYVNYQGLIFRVLMSYDSGNLADQITIDTLFGVAELRDEFGVQVLS